MQNSFNYKDEVKRGLEEAEIGWIGDKVYVSFFAMTFAELEHGCLSLSTLKHLAQRDNIYAIVAPFVKGFYDIELTDDVVDNTIALLPYTQGKKAACLKGTH